MQAGTWDNFGRELLQEFNEDNRVTRRNISRKSSKASEGRKILMNLGPASLTSVNIRSADLPGKDY